ncbi:MAG: hypothetical protein ACYTGN_08740, partial [Planctomycetota bacterium]
MRVWAVLLPLLVVGCVSAKKRMEQAQQAEAAGRWSEAADLYIDALKRDPNYPGARERLESVGARAIADYLKLAREFEGSGRDAKAAPEYERADRLAERAAVVRVSLTLPADYAERKRRTYGRVVEQALDNADKLLAEGRAEEAASAYKAAVGRYEPTNAQLAHAQDGRYGALVAAATGELDAGHWDRARSLADRALN